MRIPTQQWMKLGLLLAWVAFLCSSCRQLPGYGIAERVILIGIDGVGANEMERSDLPHLVLIRQQGAYTWRACGVEPAQRAPAWASILCGAGPAQHSVDSDKWTITQRKFDPVETDFDQYFPSIFFLLHKQRHNKKCGMFYDWPAMINLINLHYTDVFEPCKDTSSLLEKARPFILKEKASLTLLYFGDMIETKQKYGRQSPEYEQSLQKLDQILGELLDLIAAEQLKHVYILIVSGYDVDLKKSDLPSSTLNYPWLIWGSGVRRNWVIQTNVHIYDTAATIAHLFGLDPPKSWIGRPVIEAFANHQ